MMSVHALEAAYGSLPFSGNDSSNGLLSWSPYAVRLEATAIVSSLPYDRAASRTHQVPRMFDSKAGTGERDEMLMLDWAARWNSVWMPCSASVSSIFGLVRQVAEHQLDAVAQAGVQVERADRRAVEADDLGAEHRAASR